MEISKEAWETLEKRLDYEQKATVSYMIPSETLRKGKPTRPNPSLTTISDVRQKIPRPPHPKKPIETACLGWCTSN